jgi:hypothetical protein
MVTFTQQYLVYFPSLIWILSVPPPLHLYLQLHKWGIANLSPWQKTGVNIGVVDLCFKVLAI